MLPYINVPFQYVSSLLGASVDELKLITLFVGSYPLAAGLKRIPDREPWLKNVYTIAVSMFYLVGLFDMWSGLYLLVIKSCVAYLIARYVQGPNMPWIGFVWLMGTMSVSHIVRQIANSPDLIDITGAQMVLVMKLSAFCWNVHDGRQSEKDLSDFQKERAIKQMPGFLDFAGYVFFFPGLMAGPAFDYVDYRNYITTSMFDLPEGTDPSKAPPTRKKRKIPRSGSISSVKLVTGLVWVLAFLKLSGMYTNAFFLSADYMQYSFVRRVFQLYMLGFANRTKYYGVWTMTEGACILSGIGYRGIDPKTGQPAWDRLTNIKPLDLELAQNSHAYIGNWNINTNLWLRNYVYLRVTPKGKKPGFQATLATFVTSAFWHGFYPGYYLTFVLASFVQTVAKNSRRLLRPFFMTAEEKPKPTPQKIYYDIFSWFITQTAFAFITAPFVLLGIGDSLKVWSRVYFYCLIGTAASFAFLNSPGKAYLRNELKKRTAGIPSSADGEIKLERIRSEAASLRKEPMLGLPDDPEKEFDEIVAEVKAEIDRRRRRGSNVPPIQDLLKQKFEAFKAQNGAKSSGDAVDSGKKSS